MNPREFGQTVLGGLIWVILFSFLFQRLLREEHKHGFLSYQQYFQEPCDAAHALAALVEMLQGIHYDYHMPIPREMATTMVDTAEMLATCYAAGYVYSEKPVI